MSFCSGPVGGEGIRKQGRGQQRIHDWQSSKRLVDKEKPREKAAR